MNYYTEDQVPVPAALISDGKVLLKHIYDALRTGPSDLSMG